ncbi:MAG TPA: peptide deformylase [Solirubrobacteraceae bacterium]|nr:peptide deformylase [Solirubrobacteraceae bacterium]
MATTENELLEADERDPQDRPEAHDRDRRDRPEPPPLDPERAARREAALRHVRKLGDPALRTRALPVERFDDALRGELQRMGQLMSEAIGIGLAATQLGVMHRALVYRVDPAGQVVALVNPEVEWRGKEQEPFDEGCLSLPGIHVEVERPIHVRVRARDEHEQELLIEASGLEARVLQHEIDHLDGILMLDRATREQRKLAMRALREAREAGAPGDEPDESDTPDDPAAVNGSG